LRNNVLGLADQKDLNYTIEVILEKLEKLESTNTKFEYIFESLMNQV